MLGACQRLVGCGHAFEFGNNFFERAVMDVVFGVCFVQILSAVLLNNMFGCVLA